jgi:hypothetical protein
MKPLMKSRLGWVLVCGICLTMIPAVYGQESSSTPEPEVKPTGWKRLSIGFRVAGYPFNVLNNKDVNITTTTPAATIAISTSNTYLQVGVGPSLEYALFGKFSLAGELIYHRLDYTKTTQITITSDNALTGITETTSARLWDAPVFLRYRGFAESGIRSKMYVAAGGEVRDVAHIHSTTVTNLSNGTNLASFAPVVPSKRNLFGAVAGVGLRLVDDFGIKLEPEVRYTRWFGETFDSGSTRSRKDQVDVSVALVF